MLDLNSPHSAADLRRQLIAKRLGKLSSRQDKEQKKPAYISPDRDNRYEPFPLNDIQQAYWLGRDAFFDNGNVGIHGYFELDCCDLDLAAFEKGWNEIIKRHEMLRAVVDQDGMQRILALTEIDFYQIERLDLSSLVRDEQQQNLDAIREELSHEIKKLSQWPQFTIKASQGLCDNKTRLHISIDGWCLDGWSYQIIFNDLAKIVAGEGDQLPLLDISFRDCVIAERQQQDSAQWRKDWDFWQDKLQTMPPAPTLPVRSASYPVQDHAATLNHSVFKRESRQISNDVWGKLKEAAAKKAVSPTILMLSAYSVVLDRWSQSRQFTLNIPRFNRPDFHPQINEVVGEFASFSLLDVDMAGISSFSQATRQIGAGLWETLEHQSVTGVQLLRKLTQMNDGERQIMPVVFTSAPETNHDNGKKTAVGALSEFGDIAYSITQTPQVWLDAQYTETKDGLMVFWEYLDDHFPPAMVQAMIDHYVNLLTWLAADEYNWDKSLQACPAAVNQVSLEEQSDICRIETNLEKAMKDGTTILSMIKAHVDASPGATALISGRTRLSYQKTWDLSYQLAQAFLDSACEARNNDGDPKVIAIVMEKGWEQAISTLACLIAGHPYVVLDPKLPLERMSSMLDRADIAAIFVQDLETVPSDKARTILVVESHIQSGDGTKVPEFDLAPINAHSLFSIVYTSGSTGEPKGVMVTHAGMMNALTHTIERFDIDKEDRVLSVTPFHHDMAAFDLFGLLMAGGTIVIPERDVALDYRTWAQLIQDNGVTIWNSVPSFFAGMISQNSDASSKLSSLRLAFLGGDWIGLNVVQWIEASLPKAKLVSVGGPTETTLWNIMHEVEDRDPELQSIPYGRPISGNLYHILDDAMRPCPDWSDGLMHCQGVGVSAGYKGDSSQTAQRYIDWQLPSPENADTGKTVRLYNTGDLGYRRPDGTIMFAGRVDQMMKINGVRIEAAEIERILNEHIGFGQSAVVSQDLFGKPALGAFVTLGQSRISSVPYRPLQAALFDDSSVAAAVMAAEQACTKANQSLLSSDNVLVSCLKAAIDTVTRTEALSFFEIGAGSGQLTGLVCPLLHDDLDRYICSDASLAALDQEHHAFASIKNFQTCRYDINQDPGLAGCRRHEFDIVLASKHWDKGAAPEDLARHLQFILKPNGLALVVVSTEIAHSDRGSWASVFETSGFSECHTIGLPQIDEAQAEVSVLIARADDTGRQLDEQAIQKLLAQYLPATMVPKRISLLEEMPLSRNGKIDRNCLSLVPALQVAQSNGDIRPPTSALQCLLSEIWLEILSIDDFSIDDNFFALGGDSLMATQIISRVKSQFGLNCTMAELFSNPTLEGMEDAVASKLSQHLASLELE